MFIFPAYIGSSMLVPFFVLHNPSTFCIRLRFFSMPVHRKASIWCRKCSGYPLIMSCPPKCDFLNLLHLCFESFANHLGVAHCPCIFMFLLLLPHVMHRHAFTVTHHSVWCVLASLFLFTKIHFSLDLGSNSSQSFHSSTQQ